MLGGIIDGVAAKEIGAWTGIGIPAAVVAHARTQIKPMVVHDGIHIDWQVEPLAKHGRHLDDGIALLGSHIVTTPVKISKMFQADGVGILAKDTGRNTLQGPASEDRSIRESGEVLTDIRPAVGADMVIPHGLLPFEMVSTVEMRVTGVPGMVLLDVKDCPSDALLSKPGSELGKGHFCESMSAFHSVKIKV